MKKTFYLILISLVLSILLCCRGRQNSSLSSDYTEILEDSLRNFISGKNARIGIAIIVNGKDTIAVNGGQAFPMLSVYKFPQAIAVANYCKDNEIFLLDTIRISADELKTDTWSPLREKYGRKALALPLAKLLQFSLQQSDNNACDILFRLIGGTQYADSIIKAAGFNNINVLNTEDEMHNNINLCYANSSTPIEMASLFDKFYREKMLEGNEVLTGVGKFLMNCSTGTARLAAPLLNEDVEIAHKTGTGDRNSTGRIIAVNDAGYVFLKNGKGYAIAVFISDSSYDMPQNEKIIADISKIAYNYISL